MENQIYMKFCQVTVCPDWPSESLAIQTVYNMWVEFKNPYYKIAGSTQKHWIREHWISSNMLPTSRMHTLTRYYFTFFITSFMISNSLELWWHQSPLNLLFTENYWMCKIVPFQPPRWMADESMNSLVNLELRKTDLDSFLFAHEGNLWNNLIFKVKALLIYRVLVKVDELYMESCDGTSNSAFCDFTSMVLARKEETEEEEWFKHWRRMNAKMEWQFDPMWVTGWYLGGTWWYLMVLEWLKTPRSKLIP